MIGRLLCWIGWHDWGYWPDSEVRLNRGIARHMQAFGDDYRCLRCGERP